MFAFFAGVASSEVTPPVLCILATMCGSAGAGRFLVVGGMLVKAPDRKGTQQRLIFSDRMLCMSLTGWHLCRYCPRMVFGMRMIQSTKTRDPYCCKAKHVVVRHAYAQHQARPLCEWCGQIAACEEARSTLHSASRQLQRSSHRWWCRQGPESVAAAAGGSHAASGIG